jgi:hypothetical protein
MKGTPELETKCDVLKNTERLKLSQEQTVHAACESATMAYQWY